MSKGFPAGVYQRGAKWAAFTSYKGVKNHLGSFDTYEEACEARKEAFALVPKENRECPVCGEPFNATQSKQKFCTPQCKGKWKYICLSTTTEGQYKKISGDWSRYLSRLLYAAGRKRDELSREILLEILEKQNYKCAISGLDLTCKLEKGTKVWSNASVDRVNAGGPYIKDNIQLVCRAVNSWRSDMPLETFIEVCRAVAYNNPEEGKVRYAHVTKSSRL